MLLAEELVKWVFKPGGEFKAFAIWSIALGVNGLTIMNHCTKLQKLCLSKPSKQHIPLWTDKKLSKRINTKPSNRKILIPMMKKLSTMMKNLLNRLDHHRTTPLWNARCQSLPQQNWIFLLRQIEHRLTRACNARRQSLPQQNWFFLLRRLTRACNVELG
jgi:hypothetical protein